jgi:hypothetical protein
MKKIRSGPGMTVYKYTDTEKNNMNVVRQDRQMLNLVCDVLVSMEDIQGIQIPPKVRKKIARLKASR